MTSAMLRSVTAFCAAAILVFGAPGARATGPDDLTVRPTPLDELELEPSEDSERVDELVNNTRTRPDDLTERPINVDSLTEERTTRLEEVDTGDTYTEREIQAEAGPWQPPPCDQVDVELPPLPAATDYAAWGRLIHQAEVHAEEAENEVGVATGTYTQMMTENMVGQYKVLAEAKLEAARDNYGQRRCQVSALQAEARRAGVPPGVIFRGQPAAAE